MRRLSKCEKFVDWIEPLHAIASENTGLTEFGDDKAYLTGLRVLHAQQDEYCVLQQPIGYSLNLIHMLLQLRKAYEHLGIDWTPECGQGMQQWNAEYPKGKHGTHT